MFKSRRPQHYEFNVKQAESYHAWPTTIATTDRSYVPGVVLYALGRIRAVMPTAEALKLANSIADAIDEHREAACT